MREFSQDFELFIHLLSHEFIHSMEDAALFTLNPEFQNWRKDTDAVEVRLGSEDTVKKLRSAALQLSFNTVSNVPALKGLRSVAYKSGDYYPGEESPTPPDSSSKEPDIYANQLRERHAYGVQGVIARTFFKAMNAVDVARDPLTAFIRGQHGMFAAEELLVTKIKPALTPEVEEDYALLLQAIKTGFRKADAREATYAERLHLMSRALHDTELLAVDAHQNGLINLDEDKDADILLTRVYDAMRVTLQGKRILTHIAVQSSIAAEGLAAPVPA